MRRILGTVAVIAALLAGLLSLANPASGVAGFGDVPGGAYYAEAVQWLVDEGITAGTETSCFSPDAPVSRADAAVFLWRMEGSPSVTADVPFADVSGAAAPAIAWMADRGITTGTSPTSYSPDRAMTRVEAAAFLHRLAGSPLATASRDFVDVEEAWQRPIVGWMEGAGITEGTSPTTFSPYAAVSRAEMAVFLHRSKNEPATIIRMEEVAGPCSDSRPAAYDAAPTASDGIAGTPAATIADSEAPRGVVSWSDVEPGSRRLPTVTIGASIYPVGKGVQFWLNGTIDERKSSARPDGYDRTGPQDDSTFHMYPALTLRAGDELEARWTDAAGRAHVSSHTVGGATVTPDPVGPQTPTTTLRPAPPTTTTTAPAPRGVVSWSDVEPGSRRLPTVTIGASIYPVGKGVQFWLNGTIDERKSSARPDGYDRTGPQDDSTFHMYPALTLRAGDELEARWTDAAGRAHVSSHTVGGATVTPDPVGPQTPTTAPPTTTTAPAPPTTTAAPGPAPTGSWPDASNTGVTDEGALTDSGSVRVTRDGTVVENLRVDGQITIEADNVTVRNVHVVGSGKYGIKVDPDTSGTLIEDVTIIGGNAAGRCDIGIVYGHFTARRVEITRCGDGIRAGSNTVFEDNWIHDMRDLADDHSDGIQSIGGTNLVLRHNNIEMCHCMTSAMILHAHLGGPLRNVLVEGNRMAGGGYTLNIKDRTETVSNVTVRDNVWVSDSWNFGTHQTDVGAGVITWTGNQQTDGRPVG